MVRKGSWREASGRFFFMFPVCYFSTGIGLWLVLLISPHDTMMATVRVLPTASICNSVNKVDNNSKWTCTPSYSHPILTLFYKYHTHLKTQSGLKLRGRKLWQLYATVQWQKQGGKWCASRHPRLLSGFKSNTALCLNNAGATLVEACCLRIRWNPGSPVGVTFKGLWDTKTLYNSR